MNVTLPLSRSDSQMILFDRRRFVVVHPLSTLSVPLDGATTKIIGKIVFFALHGQMNIAIQPKFGM